MSDTQQTKVTGHTTRAMVMVSHSDHHMAGSQVQRQMSGLHKEGAQTSWAELGQAQLKLGCLASPHSQPGSSSLRVIKRKKDLAITISNLVITIFFFQGFLQLNIQFAFYYILSVKTKKEKKRMTLTKGLYCRQINVAEQNSERAQMEYQVCK